VPLPNPTSISRQNPSLLPCPNVKILLDYRPALRARTGVGEYVHELLLALDRTAPASDELHLFTASLRDRLDPAVRRQVTRARTHDLPIPVRFLHWTWHQYGWPPVERLVRFSPDVVHAAHPLLIPSRCAARAITIHDLDFLDHPDRSSGEIRRDYPRFVRDHAAQADAILTSSEYGARAIVERLGVSADRVTVCPAGAPRWAEGGRQRPRPSNGYILFVGTLTARKNIETLLDAYEQLIETRGEVPKLRLAGARTPAADAWLARLSEPPLAGRAEYVGYVSDAHRRALFEGASVLVLPSWNEGFGLPALEAMALGIPVVASNRGALPEVVGGAGVLFDPSRPDALADALDRVLKDPALASACLSAGLARSAAWTWDAAADRVRLMYEHAMARRGRR
jgi:O-antigen biosynthesis alpha-1,3-mannosyltransferase